MEKGLSVKQDIVFFRSLSGFFLCQSKIFKEDWPDISKKPIDHPFGPFTDGFSEEQHKYGPFKPIVEARKTKQGK